MARKARNTLNSNLVVIYQKSQHVVFRDDSDRQHFLQILAHVQRQYNCNILAFCCDEQNGFQIIIDTKGAALSPIMQSITIAYTMHRKSEYKLFEQRYKSVGLSSLDQLKSTLSHMEGKNSDFTGCCFISDDKHPWLKPISLENISFAGTQRVTNQRQYLDKWLQEHHVSFEELAKNKELRNKAIFELRQNSNCTLRKLAAAFNLTESSISKILKSI